MGSFDVLTVVGLAVSVALNAYLFKDRLSRKKKPVPTYDAKQVLRALTTGNAVLHIKVIDPEDIMLMSPKDRR